MANNSKIQILKTGQMIVTIPRAIAEAIRLKKADSIEWIFERGDLIVRKI